MDEKKFMIFLQKILENGSNIRSNHELRQLKRILEEQKASSHIIAMLDAIIESLPEAKEIAKTQMMNAESIKIAKQRADARKIREAQMAASYRGCR